MEATLPSHRRAVSAFDSSNALAENAALQFAEKRDYHSLLHAVQLRPALAAQRDDYGMRPLHWLATDPQTPLRVLQQVVLAHPDAASTRNLAGLLPVHMAVRTGLPIEALKALLKFYPQAIVETTPDGMTPLQLAKTHDTSTATQEYLQTLEKEVRALGRVATTHPTHCTNNPESEEDVQPEPSVTSSFRRTASVDGVPRPLPPVWKLRKNCYVCDVKFGYFKNRHHCRNCGESVCGRHSKHSVALKHLGLFHPQRVCSRCYGRMQSHYTNQALESMGPLGRPAENHVFQDSPMYGSYEPSSNDLRRMRTRSAVNMPSHHPLLSPRNFLKKGSPPLGMKSPPHARISRSATLSPRSCRTVSSSNTSHSAASAYSTASILFQPNFVKTPSAISMHVTHVQRSDNHRTVLQRQQEMMRRRDRLAKTDLETYTMPAPISPLAFSDGRLSDETKSLSNQTSNDDHEVKLEMQMEKLLLAKRQVSRALKQSKQDASRARAEKEKYNALTKALQERGYKCSPTSSNRPPANSDATGNEMENDSVSYRSSLALTEDNQHDHSSLSSSLNLSFSLHGDDRSDDFADDADVYGLVPEITPTDSITPDHTFSVALDLAATHRDLGAVLLAKGDFVGAADELLKASEMDSDDAQTWYLYAKALDGKGQAEEAEHAINKSLSIQPNSLPGLSLLGKLLNARGEHDEAIIVFRRALNLQSPIPPGV